MKDKKKIIIIWSCILISTIIFNLIWFVLLFPSLTGGLTIIVSVPLMYWDVVALVLWIASLTVKYKTLSIEENQIEIYAGFRNHYIKINGELKDEYKGASFSPISLSCSINQHKLKVIISPSNHIVAKLDGELVK